MDIFPTLLSLAGVTPPSDRRYDGIDATAILLDHEQTGHEVQITLTCNSKLKCSFLIVLPAGIIELFPLSCSFSSTLTVVLQGSLGTCRRFELESTKLSTSQVL